MRDHLSLAIPLFAFAISELRPVNQIRSRFILGGPPQREKVVAKISLMTIMRLPRLKGSIVRKKELKSALGFGCVGGLQSSYKYLAQPRIKPATQTPRLVISNFSELKLRWQS